MNDTSKRIEATIPTFRVNELRERIRKLNRKANKLGLPQLKLETGNTEVRRIQIPGTNPELSANPDRCYANVQFTHVTITGETPRLSGWSFVATIEHAKHGNILRSLVDYDLPNEYREVLPDCEHCKLDRRRKDTYILRNEESNEFRQIGRTCLQDYLGNDPAKAIAACEIVFRAMRMVDEEWEGNIPREEYSFETESYLRFVSACIRKFGWMSRGKARDKIGAISTADAAIMEMLAPNVERIVEIDSKDHEIAANALNFARKVIPTNDYLHNLHVACSDDYMTVRQSGIVASAITAWQRHEEQLEERKQAASKSHLGTVGERMQFENLRLLSVKWFDGQYGKTGLHRFVDTDDNVIIWWSSSDKAKERDICSFTARIKKHDTFRDEPQTVITRPTKWSILQPESA